MSTTTTESPAIKAKLKTGEIVDLKNDCGCVLHNGPHWLHMDDVDKSLNQRLLENNQF